MKASVDLRDVMTGIDEISRQGRDLSPVWRELTPAAKAEQAAHVKAQEGTTGPWPPLSPGTLAARKGKGGKRALVGPKLNFGRAISVRTDTRRLVVYSKVSFSEVHQEGGLVGRGRRVPEREFLYFSDEFIDKTRELIEEHMVSRW